MKKTKQDFILNIQYHETKDLKNQKYEVVVNHRIKGDIFGGGKFIKSSSQKEISSTGVSRPNDNQPKLRGNKSELRTASASNRAGNTRDKNPTSTTAKNEKIQQTIMKRRNDATTSKTETRTETKTATSGVRGQPKESSSTTTKTTTTRTTKTVTKVEEKGGDDAGNSVRQKYSKKKRFWRKQFN